MPQGGAIACVVAEDRPGLLSFLDTAFTARSIDIVSAQIFGRASPTGAEVVDFFWLRRDEDLGSALVEADLGYVADFLGGLMTGDLRVDGRPLGTRKVAARESATLVGFEDASDGGLSTLCLETVERPGLFHAVTTALLDAKVRIIRSKRAPGPGSRVIHRFIIAERSGRTPDQQRRGLLQTEVLRAVESIARIDGAAKSNDPNSES